MDLQALIHKNLANWDEIETAMSEFFYREHQNEFMMEGDKLLKSREEKEVCIRNLFVKHKETLFAISKLEKRKSRDGKDWKIVIQKSFLHRNRSTDPRIFFPLSDVMTEVVGTNGTKKKESSDWSSFRGNMSEKEHLAVGEQEEIFAIEMVSWEEWLSMEVDENSLRRFGESTILAACLNEMTSIGFCQEYIREYKEYLTSILSERLSE